MQGSEPEGTRPGPCAARVTRSHAPRKVTHLRPRERSTRDPQLQAEQATCPIPQVRPEPATCPIPQVQPELAFLPIPQVQPELAVGWIPPPQPEPALCPIPQVQPEPAISLLQVVERATDPARAGVRHVRVHHGRREVRVAQ